MSIAIKVENLSKAYQIGQFGTGTLSRDIERWWALTRGKEDPYQKIGEANDRSKKGESDIVWSLSNLSFEIKEGEAIGIIGKNGAGKSTLLKILSQITTPTSGQVKMKGRVASLLEVGTGFHPELTGKENIYLNGAILGMRKAEITRKFDEIVDFSGVERYIETPVKRYSSGMYVRLAFAVAAHLESEILIVDEVLAVGDLEFQNKCLGKMGDISSGEGRTVLFVSHNTNSILSLCPSAILLDKGNLTMIGKSVDVIDAYSRKGRAIGDEKFINQTIMINQKCKLDFYFEKISIIHADSQKNILVSQESELNFDLFLRNNHVRVVSLRFGLFILNEQEMCVMSTITDRERGSELISVKPGNFVFRISFSNHRLMPGKYKVRVWVKTSTEKLLDYKSDFCFLEIGNNFLNIDPAPDMGNTYSPSTFTLTYK
jgi:lipopolysaccharide transport system ATP-binding protein